MDHHIYSFRLKAAFGPGYRTYLGKDGETLIILLGGGTKKRQQKDIEAAKSFWKEYKQARNLFEIIGYLQEREGVHFEQRTVR